MEDLLGVCRGFWVADLRILTEATRGVGVGTSGEKNLYERTWFGVDTYLPFDGFLGNGGAGEMDFFILVWIRVTRKFYGVGCDALLETWDGEW